MKFTARNVVSASTENFLIWTEFSSAALWENQKFSKVNYTCKCGFVYRLSYIYVGVDQPDARQHCETTDTGWCITQCAWLLSAFARYSFCLPTEGWRRIGWPGCLVRRQCRPKTVTHPSTNLPRCRVTTLIETNALPLSQTGTSISCHFWHCKALRSEKRRAANIQTFTCLWSLLFTERRIWLAGAATVSLLLVTFLPRDTMHKRGYSRHAVSVGLYVCPSVMSRSWIMS